MINEQQKLFLASLLEENQSEHLRSELALKRLTELVDKKLIQGISFHLAAHQAINELILQAQQKDQLKVRKKTGFYIAALLLVITALSFLGYYIYQNNLSNQEPTLFPIAQESIDHFNGEIKSNTFKGIDISVSEYSNVNATGYGEVILIEEHPQMGNSILIRHNDTYKTVYGYLSKVLVKEGDMVKKGQKIGESGISPANLDTRLHYAIIENEQFIDPILFMRSAISPSL